MIHFDIICFCLKILTVLLAINSMFFLRKLLSLSPLRENFTRYKVLGCYFSLSSLKYFTQLLLVCMVSDKIQDVHHNEHSCSSILKVSFPLPPRLLSRFSLSLVFCTLHRMCSGSFGRVFWGFIFVFCFGYIVWKILACYH